MNRFINDYEKQHLLQISELLEDTYEQLPYSIAAPLENYEEAVQKGEYLSSVMFAISFFEISIQYTSGLIISLLSHHKVAFDQQLQGILSLMVEKPLSFGDWVNDIFLVLIMKGHYFIPEHPVIASLFSTFYEEKKNEKVKLSKKGQSFKDIVFYRNQAAHDTGRSNEVYKKILVDIEPRMWDMLLMVQPIKEQYFFVLHQVVNTDDESKSYTILPDRGVIVKRPLRIDTNILLEENAYYVTTSPLKSWSNLNGKDIIKLSPFIIYHFTDEVKQERKVSYIFQTLAGKDKDLSRMVFVSAYKEVSRKETELFKEDFWTFLKSVFGNIIDKQKFKIFFKRGQSLSEYKELAATQTNIFINAQTSTKKYDPELFINRTSLSDSYNTFLNGSCSAFVVLGNAGAGKTNQFCYWASQNDNPALLTLAFYSKNFTHRSLEEQIQQTFANGKAAIETLKTIDSVLAKESATLCIFFDAINECITYKGLEPNNGPVDLLLAVHRLFVENKFTHIKVVLSCRSYTWEEVMNKEVLSGHIDAYYTTPNTSGGHATLKGFSDEEFRQVYPKYASKYNLKTPLRQIEEDTFTFVKFRLYDPLILRTASISFSDSFLPVDVRQFNSTNLFGKRLNMLEEQPNGIRQIYILDEFTALLWQNFTDSVALRPLRRAYEEKANPLHEFAGYIFKDDTFHYTDAFIGLLDEGLLRVEKGVKEELRFVYERFNEYLFARHFIWAESSSGAFSKVPIAASAYETVLKNAGHSTVIIAALRNALIMDFYKKNHDPATIIRLSSSLLYETQPLVEETLSVLINESYDDVLSILHKMLDFKKDESVTLVKEKDDLQKIINKDKKGKLSNETRNKTEEQLKLISDGLLIILKVRQIAVSVIYKIFKSDHIITWLADTKTDTSQLLWIAMADPLPEVRDNASIYIYYIARYNTEIGTRLIYALSDKVKKASIYSLIRQSTRKELQQSYIEPACRIGLFLVIDGLIERKDYKLATDILQIWKDVVKKFTLNHTLIKIVMPFFKFLFARQTVVQKEYVNNAIEYRHFWDVIPEKAPADKWSREAHKLLVPYLNKETKNFVQYKNLIIQAYLTGDSFSFFLLERIMIVQGVFDWSSIADIVFQLTHLPRTENFRDYIEMSLIYTLFQINHKSPEVIPQAEKVFSSLVYDWTLRQKGYYRAHYNHIANGNKPYKQYVLYWYASAYCNRYGDGGVRPRDEANVPVLRNLIQIAYKQKDKALLYNCLDNMAILVSATGYYKTALQLFEYTIGLFNKESEIVEFDNIKVEGSLYEKGLRSFICNMLGTVKSYYPKEVDHFIVNKLKGSHFPDLEAFREEIFNHALSHESIGDLLTHKFGNFVMWGILNDENIRQFFIQILDLGYKANSYADWFDYCIRHIFQELFDVKNLEKA